MSEQQNQMRDLDAALTTQIRELITYRQDTWDWVATPHDIKDTEARLKEIQTIGTEVSRLAMAVVDRGAGLAKGQLVDSNFEAIKIVRGYERDIQECLNRDLEARKKDASDKKVDYVKNMTFLFGLPIGFVASVKNGAFNGAVSPNEAMVVGFAISIPTALIPKTFHKSVGKALLNVAKEVCELPAAFRALPSSIRNDVRLFCVKEIIRERTNSAQICFDAAAKAVNDNVGATRSRIAVGVRKLFRRNGPNA